VIDFDPVPFTNVSRAQVATRGVKTRIDREFATCGLALAGATESGIDLRAVLQR
jgi:hypothetical protein